MPFFFCGAVFLYFENTPNAFLRDFYTPDAPKARQRSDLVVSTDASQLKDCWFRPFSVEFGCSLLSACAGW